MNLRTDGQTYVVESRTDKVISEEHRSLHSSHDSMSVVQILIYSYSYIEQILIIFCQDIIVFPLS